MKAATDVFQLGGQDVKGQRFYLQGPCNGMSIDGGWLFPQSRLSSEVDADAALFLVRQAYEHGYKAAQKDIRRSLGGREST